MANTTLDYWDADGVSLQTFVQNLESWGGSREAPTGLRGDDVAIPYRPGRKFVRKVPDRRTMGLRGWLTAERNGVESELNLKQNWRELRSLLWQPSREIALTRRWRDADGVFKAATGYAQYRSGLEPEIDNRHLKFQAEFEMADPFFYSVNEVSQAIPQGATYYYITEPGDYPTDKVFIDLVGPLTGIKINSVSGAFGSPTLRNESEMTYPNIPAGTVVTLDVENFKATSVTGGVTTKTAGLVTNKYSPNWFQMGERIGAVGPRVRVTATGTGTATIRYRPAYH